MMIYKYIEKYKRFKSLIMKIEYKFYVKLLIFFFVLTGFLMIFFCRIYCIKVSWWNKHSYRFCIVWQCHSEKNFFWSLENWIWIIKKFKFFLENTWDKFMVDLWSSLEIFQLDFEGYGMIEIIRFCSCVLFLLVPAMFIVHE